ncbi:lipoyl synthase [Propionigenium maris DSM 9537]|uniref:Lipoyl synthase n=2 Tax=Propionigenium TaxID=2332 RepID=A0A9W6LPS8_9FUSO|nr:lipoyl synthase [Propionigenium maris DSM 9537]
MEHNERKPEWLRIKIQTNNKVREVEELLDTLNLNTVCREARCPNRCECYSKKTATFMIMGSICTRGCTFCNVRGGKPELLNREEPVNIAMAVERLGLKYVVVTSVTRDDLDDGGADHFGRVVEEIRRTTPDVRVEILISDLRGSKVAIERIAHAAPEVLNHNIETVPRLYSTVRPDADYRRSLEVIRSIKEMNPKIKTKSGIMLGLGETQEEVLEVFKDLREHGCDLLTVGQYLRPSREHTPMERYISPEEFSWYRERALEMGFQGVASGPLVRSSYNAWELYSSKD